MFKQLLNDVKKDDHIRIYLISGKEILGKVIELDEKSISIKSEEGKKHRYFEKLIGGWSVEEKIQKNPEIENIAEIKEIHSQKNQSSTVEDNEKTPQSKVDVEEETKYKNEYLEAPPGLKIISKPMNDEKKVLQEKKEKTKATSERTKLKHDDENSKDTIDTDTKKIPTKKTFTSIGGSLKNLANLRDNLIEKDRLKAIPANAEIYHYRHDGGGYGFIKDGEGDEYFFKSKDVKNSALLDELNNSNGINISIHVNAKLLSKKLISGYNDKSPKAVSIHYPKTVGEIYDEAIANLDSDDYNSVKENMELILNYYPNFSPASDLLNKTRYSLNKVQKYSFLSAHRAVNVGDIDKGINILEKALQFKNKDSERIIKKLNELLIKEDRFDDAIKILSDNLDLIKSTDPYNLLAYNYEAKQDWAYAIKILEKIKTENVEQEARVNKRKAIAYFQLGNMKQAKSMSEMVLAKYQTDTFMLDLAKLIERASEKGITEKEKESLFSQAEFLTISSTATPFIDYSLDNCDYHGLKTEKIRDKNFQIEDLNDIDERIRKHTHIQPKELAELLLTKAKLMDKFQPDRYQQKAKTLCRFAIYKGYDFALNDRSPVSIRFSLLEAYLIGKRRVAMFQEQPNSYYTLSITFYVNTLRLAPDDAYKNINIGIDSAINEVLSNDSVHNEVWQELTDLFSSRTSVYSYVIGSIYKNEKARKNSIQYLSKYLQNNDTIEESDAASFQKGWNQAIAQRRRDKTDFFARISSVNRSKTSEEFVMNLNSILCDIPEWINDLDKYRLKFFGDTLEHVQHFNNQQNYEDKERSHEIAIRHISQLMSEIEDEPTELSFSYALKLLSRLEQIIIAEYSQFVDQSKPELDFQIVGEGSVKPDNVIDIQLAINNKKGSAPVSWHEIIINDTTGIKFISENNEENETLKGGDEKILKLQITAEKNVIDEMAATLEVQCNYRVRDSQNNLNLRKNLALRLHSKQDFIPIENIFAQFAESGPVEDEDMFYGRDDFINNISSTLIKQNSKCIIIYGQKRSGKSSVLYHLKQKLNQSEDAFCISFSLGEIAEEISAKTFYYTILTEIEDSLEGLSQIATKPEFSAPKMNEFDESPSIIFKNYLNSFTKALRNTPGWENKKLILLLDEFTYIYTAIHKKDLSDQFMKTWKSLLERKFFSVVLIGQDVMPKFLNEYKNEFGIAEKKRLSYLNEEDAINLIEKPIWDKDQNRSRFLSKSIETIIDYTSANPFYIQSFCSRLVEYMNANKIITVTEADVERVVEGFITGEQSYTIQNFDNLISAGDAEVNPFSQDEVLEILRSIAIGSRNLDTCPRESIDIGNKSKEDDILSDLESREVIQRIKQKYYKIKVRLFKEWLIKN